MVKADIALQVLLDLTEQFTRDEPLEELLKQVSRAALQLLPGTHTSLRIFDEQRTSLLCGARAGEGVEAHPMSFRPGEGVIGWVAKHGEVAHLPDVSTDERFKPPTGDQGFAVAALLAVPLLSAGQVVGVLACSAPETGAFHEVDQKLALLLANCTVPLIDRARMERLALVDELTGAYNDRYLLPRLRDDLAVATREKRDLSILMLDLDQLKAVNREHGFGAGDRLLSLVADRVRELCTRSARLVRRGGDTFVLILPGADEVAARAQADRLAFASANQPFAISRQIQVEQTLSIGLASWDGEERALALLQRADDSLDAIKDAVRVNSADGIPASVDPTPASG